MRGEWQNKGILVVLALSVSGQVTSSTGEKSTELFESDYRLCVGEVALKISVSGS